MAEKQLGNSRVIGFELANKQLSKFSLFSKEYLSKNYIAALNLLRKDKSIITVKKITGGIFCWIISFLLLE